MAQGRHAAGAAAEIGLLLCAACASRRACVRACGIFDVGTVGTVARRLLHGARPRPTSHGSARRSTGAHRGAARCRCPCGELHTSCCTLHAAHRVHSHHRQDSHNTENVQRGTADQLGCTCAAGHGLSSRSAGTRRRASRRRRSQAKRSPCEHSLGNRARAVFAASPRRCELGTCNGGLWTGAAGRSTAGACMDAVVRASTWTACTTFLRLLSRLRVLRGALQMRRCADSCAPARPLCREVPEMLTSSHCMRGACHAAVACTYRPSCIRQPKLLLFGSDGTPLGALEVPERDCALLGVDHLFAIVPPCSPYAASSFTRVSVRSCNDARRTRCQSQVLERQKANNRVGVVDAVTVLRAL